MTRRQRGFSLIELVVAGAVLALFVAMVIPQIGVLSDRADRDKNTTDLQTLDMALQLYYQQNNNQYPPTAGGLSILHARVAISSDIVLTDFSYVQTPQGYQLTHVRSGLKSLRSKP